MDMPSHLQALSVMVTMASVAGVLLLLLLAGQLLRGRLRDALRTGIVGVLLVAVAFAVAIPVGLTPIAGLLPPP